MNLSFFLYLAAVIVALLGLFGVKPDDVNLLWLWSALVAGGLLVDSRGGVHLGGRDHRA